MGVRGLKKFKLHIMNLTSMDVSKSFWSVQCKKFQLYFLCFFCRELRWYGNSQCNSARISQYKGLSSDNHARLSELMMMMITA